MLLLGFQYDFSESDLRAPLDHVENQSHLKVFTYLNQLIAKKRHFFAKQYKEKDMAAELYWLTAPAKLL